MLLTRPAYGPPLSIWGRTPLLQWNVILQKSKSNKNPTPVLLSKREIQKKNRIFFSTGTFAISMHLNQS